MSVMIPEELIASLNRSQDIYIYGAAKTAVRIYGLLTELQLEERVRGFAVTDVGKNPDRVMHLPVFSIYHIQNKQAVIVVPHLGTYKEEILNLLTELNFQNICLINRYVGTQEEVDEKYLQFEKTQIEKWKKERNSQEREHDKILRDEISCILKKSQPDFGREKFYQSFERLGIEGERFTLYRLQRYEIDKILSQYSRSVSILDIGCNVGFLDMELAISETKNISLLGVEYDAGLVEIANTVRNYLKLTNCNFVQGDFKEWVKQNMVNFDLIFSFAIHHWLDLDPDMYVEIVDSLLNEKGYICFESHDLQSGDDAYEVCRNLFIKKQYKILNEGHIKDDGLVERAFCILQK